MNAVMMYYVRDVVGSASYFTWLFLCQTIGTIAVAAAVPAITERLGKRLGYATLAVVAVAGFVLIGLTPAGNLPLALLAFLVYGAGFGGTNAPMFSTQADTVDYGEWRTGTRAEGGFLGGAIIATFGYAAGAQSQSAEAVQGIKIAAEWAPAALCLAAALIVLFYPLGAGEHREIVHELRTRRARRALGESDGAAAVVVTGEDGGLVATRPVVTSFEQYGAGASYVAPRVAERLGVPYSGQHFSSADMERAASGRSLEASESRTSRTLRWLQSFSWPTVEVNVNAASSDAQINSRLAKENTADVMGLVKDYGGVVVGRDATVILAEMDGALHVRLEGADTDRMARAIETEGLPAEVAAQRLLREDRMRPRMSRRLMGWDPGDHSHYDLVIDTSESSLDEVVDQIVSAVEPKRQE